MLPAARQRRRTADRAEAELLELAVDCAVMHPADSIHDPAFLVDRGGNQTDLSLAGPVRRRSRSTPSRSSPP